MSVSCSLTNQSFRLCLSVLFSNSRGCSPSSARPTARYTRPLWFCSLETAPFVRNTNCGKADQRKCPSGSHLQVAAPWASCCRIPEACTHRAWTKHRRDPFDHSMSLFCLFLLHFSCNELYKNICFDFVAVKKPRAAFFILFKNTSFIKFNPFLSRNSFNLETLRVILVHKKAKVSWISLSKSLEPLKHGICVSPNDFFDRMFLD